MNVTALFASHSARFVNERSMEIFTRLVELIITPIISAASSVERSWVVSIKKATTSLTATSASRF
jgi:hypothetical protein